MTKDNKDKINLKKRKFQTSSMSGILPSLIKKMGGAAAMKNNASIMKVMNHWGEIIGAELADKSQPVRVGYKKQKNRQTGEQESIKTLTLKTDSALGTVIAMRESIILERLNRLFGVTDFKKLIIEHGFIHKPKPAKVLDENQKKHDINLSNIDDPILKDRLESLGQAVMNSALNKGK